MSDRHEKYLASVIEQNNGDPPGEDRDRSQIGGGGGLLDSDEDMNSDDEPGSSDDDSVTTPLS